MLSALIIANQLPGRDFGFERAGHGIYLAGIIDFLKTRGYDVTLLVFRPGVNFFVTHASKLPARVVGPDFETRGSWTFVRDARAAATLAAWNIYKRAPRRIQAFLDAARKRKRMKSGNIHNFGTFITPAEIAYARKLVEETAPDLIMYDSVYNACGRLSAAPHWVITHEIKHQRMESFRTQGLADGHSGMTAEMESERLAAVGNLIAIQWDDGVELERLVPGAQVVVTPVTMTRSTRREDTGNTDARCVFIGSGSYHNLDGITWFLEQCWPLIRSRRPDAVLDIFGTVCYRLGDVPPGVRLGGVVADLAAAYENATVTIVPLRVGSGLKIKLAEALSLAKAVVTTSVGAQGLLAVTPQPFVLADAADDFAEAVVTLFASPERRKKLQEIAWDFSAVFEQDQAFKQLGEALV